MVRQMHLCPKEGQKVNMENTENFGSQPKINLENFWQSYFSL